VIDSLKMSISTRKTVVSDEWAGHILAAAEGWQTLIAAQAAKDGLVVYTQLDTVCTSQTY